VRDAQSPELGLFFFVAHLFRMTLFFVIAGFFARMMLQRRGTGGFVKDRAKRILGPLLAFWPIVFAGIVATFIWGVATMNGGAMPTNPPPPPPITIWTFPLTHLWFLYMLLWLYAGALLLRGLVGLVDRSGRLRSGPVDAAIGFIVRSRIAPLVLAAPLAVVLATKADWIAWGGIPTPDAGLIPNLAAAIGFATAFGFGWLLQRQPGLLETIARGWAGHLLAAIGFTVACLWMLGGIDPVFAPEPDQARRLGHAVLFTLAVWTWTFGLIGAALRFLAGPRPAVRYVADASYWVYLMHLPVVMALQVAVYPLALPALVKFAIIIGVASILLFASYHLLVRHSWLGSWLNGRKVPWRAPKPLASQAVTA
jgi:peptidoglycan/LPS O-acetylase OafA/YrhL